MDSVASIIRRNQFNRPPGSRIRNYSVAQMQTGIEAVKDYFCHLSFQDLFCVRNPLRHIQPDAFRGLLVLQRLKLMSSHLHQLPPLQHIGHSLIYFELSRSKQFKVNHVTDFSYLRKIEDINLRHNGLQSTPLGLNQIANTVLNLDFGFNAIQSTTSMEGITFCKLEIVNLYNNRITNLRPKLLIAPNLRSLNLENNHLVSLEEVSHCSWGSSLPKHEYTAIHLRQNPWHCNGSFIWMRSNLYIYGSHIIYVKPTLKPLIINVQLLFCKSPKARNGTTVVPKDVIESVNISINYLGDLAGKLHRHLTSKYKSNLRNLILFVIAANFSWVIIFIVF